MAAGKALATGAISAKVVVFTKGVMKAMSMTTIKVILSVVLAITLIGAGVSLVYCQTAGTGQDKQVKPAVAQDAPCSPDPGVKQPASKKDDIKFLSDWPTSAATKDKLPKSIRASDVKWKLLRYKEMELAIGVVEEGDGESYLDVCAYVYNRSFKEWRRFLLANTRNTGGGVDVLINEERGMLRVVCNANSSLQGKTIIILWNLAYLSDDRAYVH